MFSVIHKIAYRKNISTEEEITVRQLKKLLKKKKKKKIKP